MKGIKVKWITSGILAVILVISLALAACAPAAPGEAPVLRIMMGTSAVVSGYYPQAVTIAGVINDNVPEVNISLVETGGTHACTGRTGVDLDMFTNTSYVGPLTRYNGIIKYEGKPFRELRVLTQNPVGPIHWMVRADSGVKTLSDLEGKKFFPGPVGSSAEGGTMHVLNTLGITIEQAYGSVADSVAMVKENRIVGFGKYSTSLTLLDATIMDVKSVTDILILSLTEEEVATPGLLMPGYFSSEQPAGTINGLEGNPLVRSICSPTMTCATSAISQEIGYKMIKAICENWDKMVLAFPSSTAPVGAMIKLAMQTPVDAAAGYDPVPLHAGAVQYYKEMGYDVPAVLIPPEYKG